MFEEVKTNKLMLGNSHPRGGGCEGMPGFACGCFGRSNQTMYLSYLEGTEVYNSRSSFE